MAFDSDKDKTLKEWKHKDGLEVSLKEYNGGETKLQIGPRAMPGKAGTDLKYRKAGRLTMDEAKWLCGVLAEIETIKMEADSVS